ncbi:penicillin-binding protein 1C [Emticicia oligotrophica DSM 17448]|uniref:peptidoglycan glycosyltransferase n=1 Tax=Emticicia oligotrophica (strain DSM 17448 / CIP 109782 / MTCC 6937 / GPTSA100-15) TaxID=929562 RepID=A0ABN4ALH6_EMTOG|nr:penicillin-binding protein 1C [Emticicia oligotrophica DSM 17448]
MRSNIFMSLRIPPKLLQIIKYRSVKVPLFLLGLILILNILFPPKIEVNFSTIITDRNGQILHTFLSKDEKWRMFVTLEEITPVLRKAILAKEDKYFYYHFGVNPVAIIRATVNNVLKKRRTSGASTITMQVVRMLRPNKRTYLNKITEILRAIQLEIFYSKDEILQMYLNLVPYGSNIEGIKSASYLYFQKSPDRLSLAEVTTLAIIPNRPTSLRLGTRNPLITEERNKWLKRFEREKVFDSILINDAIREPLNAFRHEAPKEAPHLSIRLQKNFPTEAIIKASVSKAIQTKVEQMVANYVNRTRAMNINNAAVLVLNNETMQIEAYVGSAGFGDKIDAGQVDGIQAIRSPGSALKPLLYATAFDKGILTPKNIINDVPTNFNGFEPENFDKKFNGKVTVEFALANSLNIPAVKAIRDLGKVELIEKLKKADFQTIRKQEKDLGLSIVLGGCGVTLEEMTQLYASFANEGNWQKANYLFTENPQNSKVELLSSSATYLITEILAQIKRPDLPNNFDYTYRLPKISWKTGTSFGRRDAWSIGYNKKYTVGVWVGNFSGEGVPELSGAEIATPLLFQIFNTIDYNSSSQWFRQPQDVVSRQVCAESGDLPSEYCSNKILDYSIKNISHTHKCSHLKKVYVNLSESMSYCVQCLPSDAYKEKLYANLAPELISFYEQKHILYDKIPAHNPNCTRFFSGSTNAPLITNPNNGSEYYLSENDLQQMQLACQPANDVKEVYWYVNDKLLQKTPANKAIFFTATQGKVKISCTDDKGRSSSISIMVK